MSDRFRRLAVPLALAVLSLALVASASALTARHRTARPAGSPSPGSSDFVGMNADGAIFDSGDGSGIAEQFAAMSRSGVRTVRVAFSWARAQPYARWADVPARRTGEFVDVGGVPTDFSELDQIVSTGALYGLRLLPVVIYTPGWDASPSRHGLSTPARVQPYADFLTALIQRYGPSGSYWKVYSPQLPVRQWQVWNEPDISYYWPQPSLTSYLALLRAAHTAITQADPGARTVIAAIANRSWTYLAGLYRVPGARSLFDVVAANPFTSRPAGVVTILRLVRATMNAFGDRHKPLMATEVGWTSARGVPGAHADWDTTEAGQARNVGALLPLLAANRRALGLASFYVYTWVADESRRGTDWNFAGLTRIRFGAVVVKPALAAFQQAATAIERGLR